MAITSVDIDPDLLKRARALTGAQSNRAVINLALRRMIALQQKSAMIEGVLQLPNLAQNLAEIGAADADFPVPTSTRD